MALGIKTNLSIHIALSKLLDLGNKFALVC